MAASKKGGTFFPVLFICIGILFVSILIVCYRLTRLANPIMLDEKGRVQGASHP